MNPRSLLLIATLGTNCALAAMLLRSPSTPPATNPAADSGQPTTNAPKSKNTEARAKAKANAEAPAEAPPAPPAFNWATLESADFKHYIQNLRDLGVPEETIRDLIRAEVTKMYQPKMLALRPASNPQKYWERNYGGWPNQQTAEQRQQQTALYKEQAELLKSLLGETPMTSEHPMKRTFTDATPEVLKQISELHTKMGEKQQELYAKAAGHMDGDSFRDQRKIEREFYTELAKLVPPEQLEAYKLRNSERARELREDLRVFAPTEEEFKAIFRVQEHRASLAVSGPTITAEQAQRIREAPAKAEAALVEALGAERAKESKTLVGYEFTQLASAGIPRETILRVAEMKVSAEQAVANLRKDTTLSAEQRSAALLAIRTETEKELATLLGERRAKAYPNSGGYWIRNLSSTPSSVTRIVAP